MNIVELLLAVGLQGDIRFFKIDYDVEVTNCNGYFVYNLTNYGLRYCAKQFVILGMKTNGLILYYFMANKDLRLF